VPHAGFGLGFERLLVYVCGLSNIRDAIPYPTCRRHGRILSTAICNDVSTFWLRLRTDPAVLLGGCHT
jgi:aspartyl-tRNA synthetase